MLLCRCDIQQATTMFCNKVAAMMRHTRLFTHLWLFGYGVCRFFLRDRLRGILRDRLPPCLYGIAVFLEEVHLHKEGAEQADTDAEGDDEPEIHTGEL